MINTILQILLSVFLIGIMAFIGYSIYNKDLINSIDLTTSNRKITKVFSGILDYTTDKDISIETSNKNAYGYLDINPSINQNGGSEYSYNFWLYFDVHNEVINNSIIQNDRIEKVRDVQNNNKYKYLILFYKGEKPTTSQIPLIREGNANYDCSHLLDGFEENILIKNPLVKLRNDGKKLIIDYNNINYPTSYNSTANEINCNNTNEFLNQTNDNKFGFKEIDVDTYKKQFNMITIVFKEQPTSEQLFYKHNASCKIYFNKKLVSDRLANINNLEKNDNLFKSRAMKSNFSKLHINPVNDTPGTAGYNNLTLSDGITQAPPLQMADLTYFNYALNQAEINRLYDNGFNKYPAIIKKRKETILSKGDYISTNPIKQV